MEVGRGPSVRMEDRLEKMGYRGIRNPCATGNETENTLKISGDKVWVDIGGTDPITRLAFIK